MLVSGGLPCEPGLAEDRRSGRDAGEDHAVAREGLPRAADGSGRGAFLVPAGRVRRRDQIRPTAAVFGHVGEAGAGQEAVDQPHDASSRMWRHRESYVETSRDNRLYFHLSVLHDPTLRTTILLSPFLPGPLLRLPHLTASRHHRPAPPA